METYNHKQSSRRSTSSLNFNLKEEVIAERGNIKQQGIKVALITAGLSVVGCVLGDLLRVLTGDVALFMNAPIAAVAMLAIPFFIGPYIYLSATSNSEAIVGIRLFIKYTQCLMDENSNIDRFKELGKDALAEQLANLRGLTYSQLSIPQKELVIYSVANEFYAPEWLFSMDTLKEITTANSNYSFHQIINNTSDVIKGKEKFIRRKIQRVQSYKKRRSLNKN